MEESSPHSNTDRGIREPTEGTAGGQSLTQLSVGYLSAFFPPAAAIPQLDPGIPHSTEPFTALDFASSSADFFIRLIKSVAKPLMVSLGVIMLNVLTNSVFKGLFSEEDDATQAFVLEASEAAFHLHVQNGEISVEAAPLRCWCSLETARSLRGTPCRGTAPQSAWKKAADGRCGATSRSIVRQRMAKQNGAVRVRGIDGGTANAVNRPACCR